MDPVTSEEKSENLTPHLQTLRTFQGDVEETIHKKKESVVSIAVAEQKAHDTNQEKKVPGLEKFSDKKENLLLTYGILPLVGVIFILLGGGFIVGAYYYLHGQNQPLSVTSENLLLQYSSKKIIILDNTEHRITIQNSFTSQLNQTNQQAQGSLLYIDFKQGTSSLSVVDFLKMISSSAPNSLLRSLSSSYMSGILAVSNVQETPFFIFSSDSFGDTYTGMLAWEPTLPEDMAVYFGAQGNNNTTIWTDESFNNHDVRVFRDSSGNIRIVYGFINKNILIITGGEQAFETITNKYINARLVK